MYKFIETSNRNPTNLRNAKHKIPIQLWNGAYPILAANVEISIIKKHVEPWRRFSELSSSTRTQAPGPAHCESPWPWGPQINPKSSKISWKLFPFRNHNNTTTFVDSENIFFCYVFVVHSTRKVLGDATNILRTPGPASKPGHIATKSGRVLNTIQKRNLKPTVPSNFKI